MKEVSVVCLETCGYTTHIINVSRWNEKLCSATEFISLCKKNIVSRTLEICT